MCGRSGLVCASQHSRMASHTLLPSSPSHHHRMMSQVANPATTKLARSSSRMSSASRGSSDEDQSKTAVRVGTNAPLFSHQIPIFVSKNILTRGFWV